MNYKRFEQMLNEGDINVNDLDRFSCDCPKRENENCEERIKIVRMQRHYTSGIGYTPYKARYTLCGEKITRELDKRKINEEMDFTQVVGEEGGIEDIYGEGGFAEP